MLGRLLGLLAGPFARELREAYQARLDAQNDAARIEADQRIVALENARAIARIEAADLWSATRIGRLMVVVPFGLWWAAIFVDSTFDLPLTVLALPADIMALAEWLVPAILVADVADRFAARRAG